MAGTYDKARAVFLAALMVVSVFGGSLAFAGTAAAAEGPVFGEVTPTDGTVVTTSTPDISVAIENESTDINASTIEVNIEETSGGDVIVHQVNEPSDDDDGIEYVDGNVTVDLTAERLQELPDGTYDVTVSAEDTDGDYADTDFTFTVDTETDIDFTFDAPTDDDDTTSGVQVADATPQITVGVTVNGDDKLDMANITAYDEDGEVLFSNNSSSEDDVFTDGQFDFTPQSELPDEDITLVVNATDTDGNSAEETFSFLVDTNQPAIESVDVSPDEYYAANTSGDVTVSAEFDEAVNASSVKAKIVDPAGESDQVLEDFSHVEGDDTTVTQSVELADNFDDVENGSVDVVVTDGADLVGNSVNHSASSNNTTFALDTLEPTITYPTLPSTFDGLMDLEQHVEVSDAQSYTIGYYLNGERHVFDNPDASNVDIDNIFPEGYATFSVNATDENGTTVYNDTEVTVDTVDPQVEYAGDDGDVLTGTFNVSDHVEVEYNGTENVNRYGYTFIPADGSENVSDWNNTVTAQDGEYLFKVEVNNPRDGEDNLTTLTASEPVEGNAFESDEISLSSEINDNDAGELNVTVTADDELDELNVTVESVDNFHSQNSEVLTLEDFDSESDSNVYTAQYEVPRDGQYDVTLNNATNTNGLVIEGDVDSADEITVDNSTPEVVDADVVGGDDGTMDVRVRFSEPVDSVESIDDFNGATVSGDVDRSGEVTLTIEDEVQTGGNATLTFNGLSEVHDEDGDVDATSTSEDVTYALDISKGVNVVSIPAETGYTPLGDLDLAEKGIHSVWAYDSSYDSDGSDDSDNYSDEWANYVVGEDSEFQDLEYLEGGDGYLVVANENTELDLEVENVPNDDGVQMSYEQLESGWNLVGAYQEGDQPAAQAFSTLKSSTSWSVEKGYTGDQVDTVKPGEGYWLFVNEDGNYHVPVDYDGLNSEQATVANVEMTDDDDVLTDGEEVTITADVSDDSILSSVKVTSDKLGIDTELSQDSGTTYTGTATIDFGDVSPDEMYTFEVAAIDADGNIGYGQGTSLPVESTSPTVSDYQVTNPDSQNVKVSFNSSEQLSSVSATVSGAEDGSLSGVGSDFTETNDSGTYTYEATYSGSSDGDYTVTLDSAVDAAGNDGADSESDLVTVDTTAPTSSLDAPDEGATTNTDTVEFSFSDDTSGVDSATLTIENSTSGEVLNDSVDVTGSTSYDISGLDDGDYNATLNVEDNAGNSNTSTVNFTRDATAPSLASASFGSVSDFDSDDNNETQITATIEDNTSGLDVSSIEQGDFYVENSSTGEVAIDSFDTGSVEDGDNSVTVTIEVEGEHSSGDLEVSLAEGGSISDTVGNALTDGNETAQTAD